MCRLIAVEHPTFSAEQYCLSYYLFVEAAGDFAIAAVSKGADGKKCLSVQRNVRLAEKWVRKFLDQLIDHQIFPEHLSGTYRDFLLQYEIP